jgi:hypothetical protein
VRDGFEQASTHKLRPGGGWLVFSLFVLLVLGIAILGLVFVFDANWFLIG